jgi:DNA invertase Pin-like site-specific DNA recombinase
MTTGSMRVIGYARVSTDEQAASGLGLDAQEAAIRAETERRGWELVEVITDAGISGGRAPADRPGFAQVLQAMAADRADGVIVAKLDRLTRSLTDFAALLERSARDDWAVVALDVDVDTTSATGRLVAHVMGAVSEWERGVIGERTKAALESKRAQGHRLGRPVTLPPAVRQRIERERAAGLSLARIGRGLDADRVPTAQGGARWYPATVRAVLRSLELDVSVG